MSGLKTTDTLQLTSALRHTNERQQVAFLKRHLRTNSRKQFVAPLYLGEVAIGQASQTRVLNSSPGQITAFGHQHFHMVFASMLPLLHHALTLWQEITAQQQHEQPAPQQNRDTDPGHIKNAKRRKPFFLYQTVNNQVGTGANQRTGAAQDRRIAKRQQQFGS